MAEDQATEPVDEPVTEPEVAPEETPEVEPEGEEQEVQPEEPEAPPETVEVEINGQTYSVPAALKDGYMQHADYTQKTQDIAAKGKALEGDREALKQQAATHAEHVLDYGELAHTDKTLEQFRQVDWQKLQQEDPEQMQQLGIQFQVLRDTRDQIVGRIQKREHELRATAEREHADRAGQLKATLARDIPNYSPDMQTKMDNTAINLGFSKEDLGAITDPRYMRILHLAHLGEQVLKRQAAAKPKAPDVKPVPKVGIGSSPKPGVHDGLSMDEWARRETQRMAKLAG